MFLWNTDHHRAFVDETGCLRDLLGERVGVDSDYDSQGLQSQLEPPGAKAGTLEGLDSVV